jgi:sec-independent protein translocase protein TatA
MSFGVTEMLVVLAIVLIVFGAGKLPSVMGDLAKGVRNFKAGLKDEPETTERTDGATAAGEVQRLPPAG